MTPLASLVVVFSPMFLAGFGWLGAKAWELLKKKVKNETLKSVLLRLDSVVLTVVKGLQQTVVEDLKKASADGKLSSEERRRLKQQALEEVHRALGSRGVKELRDLLDLWEHDVDKLIGTKVEATVFDLKKEVARPEPVSVDHQQAATSDPPVVSR